jgi:hypothetical protein
MKKTILALTLVLPLAACTQTEQGAVIGGAGGAAVGAAVAGSGSRAEGALIGGAIGATAGALVGRAQDRAGYCEFRNPRTGRIYVDRCPRGY